MGLTAMEKSIGKDSSAPRLSIGPEESWANICLATTIACSVSSGESALKDWAKTWIKAFNLNDMTCGDFPITYPHPGEIGQDRIANSLVLTKPRTSGAGHSAGTATTFDAVGEGRIRGRSNRPGPRDSLIPPSKHGSPAKSNHGRQETRPSNWNKYG